MIDRRSVPAPHRACLHQYEDHPGGREPAGILRLDSLKTDMTASLALGVVQRVLALWFLTSRHGPRSPLRNALQWDPAANELAYFRAAFIRPLAVCVGSRRGVRSGARCG